MSPGRAVRAVAAAVLALGGCGDQAPVAPEPEPIPLVSVRVEPAELLLASGPGDAGRADFTAYGTFEDGVERPLETVAWSVSNPSAGEVDADGLFRASTENGGVTWVTATLDGVEGLATVTVRYTDEVVDPAVDPAWFAAAPEIVDGAWRYPEDAVALPRNTPSIHWQWVDPSASIYGAAPSRGYRLRFESALTALTWYTAAPELVLDEATWATIASTNAGGEVAVTLEAAAADGRVLAEEPIAVRVQRMDARGSVIYWSTTASGLVEIPYGDVARDFLTAAQTERCVGCHAISRQGLIAFTYDGGNGALGVKDLATGADLPGATGGNFSTFSPDGTRLLTATYGNLELRDPYTGALIGVPVATANASHPDWAPDGSAVVFTQTDGHVDDWYFSVPSRIAIMDYLGGDLFSAPRVLYTAPAGQRAYYPSWSPDSQWIAFNVSTGDAYDDPDAELHVMYRTGDFGAVRLDAANAVGAITNSWPRWAPLPDDDVLWLAFASKRPYGVQTSGVPQIWVTAIDPGALAAGQDPSSPAFWLPGQPTSTGNHIPVWVE